MLILLANALVMAGIVILLGSLLPMRQIVIRIPAGPVRRQWYAVIALTLFFIFGYFGYLAKFWNQHRDLTDLLVPSVLFLGACFVFVTSRLSLQTATDVRHIALLEQENITDPLTGLYNRRYLSRRFAEEFARAQRYNLPLSVLLLDIDHFKQLNDTYGHTVGDLVLSHLGRIVQDRIRASDIAARYGGEEFMIIAPNTAALPAATLAEQLRLSASAAILAEQLRHSVESQALLLISKPDQQQEIRITISIGVAELARDMGDAQRLIHNADRALYQAKQEGRNRVVIYDPNATNALGSPGEASQSIF